MPFTKQHSLLIAVARVVMDIGWIVAAYACAVLITLPGQQTWQERATAYALYGVFFAVMWCVVATDQGLFTSRRSETLVAVIFSMAKTFCVTLLLSAFLIALFIGGGIDRGFFLVFGSLALGAALAFTLVARPSVWNLRRRGYNFRRILIIGANNRTAHLVDVLLANEQYGFHIIGFLEDDADRRAVLERYDVRRLGSIADLERVLLEQVIDGVYISLPVRSCYETIQNIAHLCESVGVPVRLLADLFPLRMASSEATHLGDLPLLSLSVSPEARTRFALRRAVDFVASLVLLLALTPVFLLVALWIKLDSKGPVFASKTLLVPLGRSVKMIGFRVRPVDAPQEGDARSLTSAGKRLKQYGMDELPFLINVLLGQVRLIGPRPPSASNAETLPPPATQSVEGKASDATRAHTAEAKAARPRGARRSVSFGLFALLDACCIAAAYGLAVRMTAFNALVFSYSIVNYVPYLVVFVLVWFAAAIDERLWNIRPREGLIPYLSAVGKAVGDAAVFCVFLGVLFSPEDVPRRFLVAFCVATLMVLLASRIAFRVLVSELHRHGHYLRRGLIVGANERTARLIEALRSGAQHSCRLEGLMDDDAEKGKALSETSGLRYLGPVRSIDQALAECPVDEVYVSLPVRSHYEAIQRIAQQCETAGVAVHLLADLFPLRIATSRVMRVEDIPLVSLSPICEAQAKLALKRLIDGVCSTVLILGCSPVFAAIAALIKLDSQGPVFFTQERVGQNGRRFKMIKFRSMVVNAEDLRKALEAQNEADGPVFKIREDPRVTRVGRFIRKFSLDELPQLFNVWWGEMSLVGPRPPIPAEVERYSWSQRRRLSVKPGMTGLWQVSGRSDVNFDQWVSLDLAYIDNWSIAQDFVILLKTFRVVVTGRGAA